MSMCYYGAKHALKNVSLDVGQQAGAGDDRSVRLRQIHLPALPESHERHHCRRARHRPDPARRAGHPRPARDVVQLRARVGMVFQKPNPFPKSIYDNVAYGPRMHGLARGRADLDDTRVHQPAARRACGTKSRIA